MLLADRYAELHETTRVRERTLFPPQRIPSELELQARWFAGDFGKHFVTSTGDKIDIVQFGIWPLRFLVRRTRDEYPLKTTDSKLRLTRSPKNGATLLSEMIVHVLRGRSFRAHSPSCSSKPTPTSAR